jgi:hypothetical protein
VATEPDRELRSYFLEIVRRCLDAMEPLPDGMLDRLADLGVLRRVLRTDNPALDEASATAGNAAAAVIGRMGIEAPAGPRPDRAAARQSLTTLGTACLDALGPAGDDRLFRLAVIVFRKVVLLTDLEAERPAILLDAGLALATQYDRLRASVLLAGAVTLGRDATAFAPADHPIRPTVLSFLAAAWRRRYEADGGTDALVAAIAAAQAAVRLSPLHTGLWPYGEGASVSAARLDRARRLTDLGWLLRCGYELTGRTDDLEEALSCHREAVELFPADEPVRGEFLAAYCMALLRPGPGSDPGRIAEAVRCGREAVRLRAEPAGPAALGAALHHRFVASGDPVDLDAAIGLLRRAASAAGLEADDYRSELGAALVARFGYSGDTAALTEAIEHHRYGAASPRRWPIPAVPVSRRLARLGAALAQWSRRTGDAAAADESIATLRAALADPPRDIRERGAARCQLANALHDRFYATGGRPEHLREAVLLADQIMGEFPEGHPARAAVVAELQDLPHRRAQLLALAAAHDAGDADPPGPVAGEASIRDRRAAVAAAPVGSQVWAGRLVELGLALSERDNGQTRPRDLAEAADAFARAARTAAVTPVTRSIASREWARLAAAAGDWSAAASAYGLAVGLLPQLAPGELRREDQEFRLTPFARLACDAAACALRAGRPPAAALDLLERGRGVLLAQALRTRAEPPEPAAAGTVDGLVVAVNVSVHGCDAIIASADGVESVPLPDCSGSAVDVRAEALAVAIDLIASDRSEPEHRWAAARFVQQTLGWLWDTIAEPVLTALGDQVRPARDGSLPRLWWMPTGMLTFHPLHAAGYHEAGEGGTVLDRVVSSYTPTIRLLGSARAAWQARRDWAARRLVVAVPSDTLPGAALEAESVAGGQGGARLLAGPAANRADVNEALRGSTSVHFACHARSVVDQPSTSYLQLHDGPLSVRDIADLELPDAVLAYLSACGTHRGGTTLADEAIHVSGAFQLAGYPHVIGTLWSIADDVAAELAAKIYPRLATGPGDIDPARAVHSAVRWLRQQCEGRSPNLWAAHIHVGP